MKKQKNEVITNRVIPNLIWNLQRLPWSFLNNLRGRSRIKYKMTSLYKDEALNKDDFRATLRSGFTLIEVLVVVLIIGILAAVAVPQYQKAVLKSRFATVKDMAQSLVNAEEIYYLANGKYTADFSALDIDLPPSQEEETGETSSSKTYDTWKCYLYNDTSSSYPNTYVYCGITQNGQSIMGIQIYPSQSKNYANRRWCVVSQDSSDLSSLTNQVCKNETNQEGPLEKYSGATWKVWQY